MADGVTGVRDLVCDAGLRRRVDRSRSALAVPAADHDSAKARTNLRFPGNRGAFGYATSLGPVAHCLQPAQEELLARV